MYRPASRSVFRAASSLRTARATPTTSRLGARYLTTAPPHKTSRSWKNAALRWGAAVGVVYWYNTTDVFAEEPTNHFQPPESHYDPEPLPTIDSLALQRKQREAAATKTQIEDVPTSAGPLGDGGVAPGSPEALEAEAGQQGAFNEETGEINWDCPCLGGMADGPCGENFKEAFSCFVFSKEEPKGVDCIEKFKGMQDCFRQHPDIYGAELEDDEDDYEGEEGGPKVPVDSPEALPAASTSTSSSLPTPVADTPAPATKQEVPVPESKTQKAKAATEQVKKDHSPLSESEELVPRAAHDAR